jgi:hypothetical protein
MPKPPPNTSEPVSYWELERRSRSNPEHRGQYGGEAAGSIADQIPKLPPTSPWSSDPCGPEPFINGEGEKSHG